MFDILIKNGKIIDGTGNPWTYMDIAINNGKIQRMERNINESAKEIIDATDKIVCPGFIDTHTHSDLLCTKPKLHQIRLKQGITTELLGQDGISVAPVSEETKPLWQQQLKGLNGDIGEWNWNSISDYLEVLNNSNPLGNITYLVPHGNVRTLVMGFEERTATQDEITEMRYLVEKAMEEGAVGLSSGLVYPPNVFSSTNELIELCKGVAKYDGCFVVHMRNESFHILDALDEMIRVAKESGVRLHISHLKVIGKKNRHFYPKVLEQINLARKKGIEITFDQYPYTAASTVFHSILPPWMHDGGNEEMISRLQDSKIRKKIESELYNSKEYENWVYNCGWENIVIASVGSDQNLQCVGKSIEEIAKEKKKSPANTAFDLLVEEEGNVTMIVHWGIEEDIEEAMKSPYHIVGSDGIFGEKPHPRLSGSYSRVLSRYVKEREILSLEEAIHHMTGAPAQLLRLKDRGILKQEYWADIVILDINTVEDRPTYENPMLDPIGIDYVLVNGVVGLDKGKIDLNGNGKVLYGESYKRLLRNNN